MANLLSQMHRSRKPLTHMKLSISEKQLAEVFLFYLNKVWELSQSQAETKLHFLSSNTTPVYSVNLLPAAQLLLLKWHVNIP